MNHLSDEEIQAYLLGEKLQDNKQVTEHIRNCKICQEQVAAYRLIFGGLTEDEGMLLPADFPEKVVQKVSVRFRATERIREPLLIGLTAVFAIATFLWMIDIEHFLQLCNRLVHTVATSLINELPFLSHINLTMLISTLVILLLINVFDSILQNIKHH